MGGGSIAQGVVLGVLCLVPSAAVAWEFQSGTPCRLTHIEEDVAVELTFQPQIPLYTMSLTALTPWPSGREFSMTFLQRRPLRIATERHEMRDAGRTIFVEDAGFGNVLNGLQFNDVALAQLGSRTIELDLDTAPEAVEAFRNCGAIPSV